MPVYKLANLNIRPRGGVTGHLTEDGSIIATVARPTQIGRYRESLKITKCYSHRAANRFSDFCNCLSQSEVLDILFNNATAGKQKKVSSE